MKQVKNLGLLAIALLLSHDGISTPGASSLASAHRLSEAQLAWNTVNSHSHSHTHHRKKHRKHHHKHSEEESESDEENKDEDKAVKHPKTNTMIKQENSANEDAEVSEKQAQEIKSFKADDATIQDIYTFSKVIANGKTAQQALKEEQDKLVKMQQLAQREN